MTSENALTTAKTDLPACIRVGDAVIPIDHTYNRDIEIEPETGRLMKAFIEALQELADDGFTDMSVKTRNTFDNGIALEFSVGPVYGFLTSNKTTKKRIFGRNEDQFTATLYLKTLFNLLSGNHFGGWQKFDDLSDEGLNAMKDHVKERVISKYQLAFSVIEKSLALPEKYKAPARLLNPNDIW